MPSIFGRAIIETPTNKSGGSLAKGDVVVVDTTNDYAVTTSTAGSVTIPVGVVVEENGIASNAAGRVQFGGKVDLVNVNASVTRGHYGLTHTVAKQAADGGASRVVGAFCIFVTGGTTPAAHLFVQPDGSSASGNVATDAIWDAAGDLVQGTGANTAAKLSAGTAGFALTAAGAAAALVWAKPKIIQAHISRTAGSYSPNNTSWTDLDTGLDLTIAALSGDVIEVGASGFWSATGANTGALDVATIVAAAPVNYLSGGGGASDLGIQGWVGLASTGSNIAGSVLYTLQAGDVSGGNVLLRLRYRTSTASAKSILGTTAQPFQWFAKNLGQ